MKTTITLRKLALIASLFLCVLTTEAQIVTSNADDGTAGTLRSQIAAAPDGGTITFLPAAGPIVLTSGAITIDKSLFITGVTMVTINGNDIDRIFTVTEGTVTLTNLRLVNGQAENGGAIHVSNADLVINTSEIINNVANGASGSGGGIFVGTGATLLVTGSEIRENRANRAGGGIESVAGTTVILNQVILNENNAGVAPATAAPGNGGGLHVTGNGTVEITGGTVNDNIAALEGGGLWNGTGEMNVTNVMIQRNSASGNAADDGGGGIFNNGGMVNINGSELLENEALGTSGSGGGIFNNVGGSLSVSSSSIIENSSNRAGGGIENNAGSLVLNSVMLNNNMTFTSPGNGGGLHITGAGSATITDGTVVSNEAGAEGGGLWNGSGTMTIDGTLIDMNSANGALADQGGGGIYNLNGGTLVINNAVISNNMATGTLGSGGGILNDVGSQLSITDSEITGNSAVRAGGGIEDNSGTSTISLTNVNLNGNTVTGPPGNGGGLHITGGGNVVIEGGTVSGNTASLEGGGLWNGSGTMTLTNVSITENTADGDAADDGGGGIFNTAGTVTISECTLTENNATGTSGSGGGILSIAGTVSISDSTLELNNANRAGGAIEIVNGTLMMNDSDMMTNNVNGAAGTANPGNGGALHISAVAMVTINGGVVSGNTAKREGGGLWNQTGSTMTLNEVTISSNNANGQDAIHGGGGIFNNGGNLIVNASTISNNASDGGGLGNGGGIHIKAGTVEINVSTISGNISVNDGGGIYNNASLSINASTIANNFADQFGGGLANGPAADLLTSLTNTIVANNMADSGKDIYAYDDSLLSGSYNLIGQDDTNDFDSVSTDIEGTSENPVNPMLGPLADNGGPTFTHALLEGSPAYNAGNPEDQFMDQRGMMVFNNFRDIGSFEAQSQLGTDSFLLANSQRSIIAPNPSNGLITINLADTFGENVNGKIIEIGTGKVIMNFKINSLSTEVSLDELASGVFIVQIASGNYFENHKLVVGK